MDGYLRQATASQSRLIGPFVDDTDFKTAKTALTVANTDIKLRANGTTLANKNSGGGTHQVNGNYSVTWDATDTANIGELKYSVVVASALQVFGSYVVVEEAVYDALYAASAEGPATPTNLGTSESNLLSEIVDIQARIPAALVNGRVDSSVGAMAAGVLTASTIATGAVTGDGLATDAVSKIQNTLVTMTGLISTLGTSVAPGSWMVLGVVAGSSSTTSIITSSLTPTATVTDQFKGRIVIFDADTTTTNLRGQGTTISASTAGGVLTVTALTDAPVSGDTFVIV